MVKNPEANRLRILRSKTTQHAKLVPVYLAAAKLDPTQGVWAEYNARWAAHFANQALDLAAALKAAR